MKFYTFPGSCSTSIHITLLETGIDFEYIIVDLRTERKLPDGRKLEDLNPKNYVPVLELDDGTVLTEVVAILQYLGDAAPESQLTAPAGTMDRFRLNEMLAYLGAEIYKTFELIRLTDGSEEDSQMVRDRLNDRFAYLDSILENQQFLNGDAFSVTDAYLFTMLDGATRFYMLDYAAHPNLVRYLSELRNRPSVKEAIKAVDDFIEPGFTRMRPQKTS